jgi:hypothetical protein
MFIKNQPAMKIGNALVIADLHIGIALEMYRKGVSIPNQSKSLAKKVNGLKRLTKTKRLFILGDVKHSIYRIPIHEIKEVPEFLNSVKYDDITILKGNHDGNIEKIVKLVKKNIKIKKSVVIGEFLLTHGHRIVKTNKIIVMGHNQPNIKFRDKVGALYFEPVWLRGKTKDGKKVIVMPAFNSLCGATIVNKDELIGPIAKKLIRNRTHAYLLDGTDLGNLKDLQIE